MRRLIVILLEKACVLQHEMIDRFDWTASLWYARLDLSPCVLASWSDRLDQKWKTGVWTDA